MLFKYQIIFLGAANKFKIKIVETVKSRISDLNMDLDSVQIIDGDNLTIYNPKSPTVAIYFGDNTDSFPDTDMLDILIYNCAFIVPIVESLTNFTKKVPTQLKYINGFKLYEEIDVEPLVSILLENLNLLRQTRRLFISYKQKESKSIAIQLYEYLDEHGFNVFLDTHSIRPGEPFQEELWHNLVDTDVVIILNTPGFLKSKWTVEELAKASSMSIGILQIVWPNYDPEPSSAFCLPNYLDAESFIDSEFTSDKIQLTENSLKIILNGVESMRARSLSARQGNLVKEFFASSLNFKIQPRLQPQKFIQVNRSNGQLISLYPIIGVPNAYNYNEFEELIKLITESETPESYLLFDPRLIRNKWQKHIAWLDKHLKIKSVKITGIDEWLKNTLIT